tara:strand:+ start:365 stop:595 length:231 start_codon:yes stop_codon:yes gene_type:complete
MTVNQQTISNLSKVGSLVCEARCLLDEVVAELSETKVDEMDQWELEDTLGQLEICEGVLDTINGKGLIEVEEEEEV